MSKPVTGALEVSVEMIRRAQRLRVYEWPRFDLGIPNGELEFIVRSWFNEAVMQPPWVRSTI